MVVILLNFIVPEMPSMQTPLVGNHQHQRIYRTNAPFEHITLTTQHSIKKRSEHDLFYPKFILSDT